MLIENKQSGPTAWMILPVLMVMGCGYNSQGPTLELHSGDTVVLIGGNLCSRMMSFGYFETELHVRYPALQLTLRNMCDGGNTPGFRPHPGRTSPWAFPGADSFQTELAQPSGSQGHFETPDEWLTRLEADVILAFFGYNESFAGPEGLATFEAELEALAQHTLAQQYNGVGPPRLALVSPAAFENLSDTRDLPDGRSENANLSLYAEAIERVASRTGVPFVDLLSPTARWFRRASEPLTIDGAQLTEDGYLRLAELLADRLFSAPQAAAAVPRTAVHAAVQEKNWLWHNDFKIPNGVHVFGRRYNPFGPDNYPAELEKIRQMTAIRDTAIWYAARGEVLDLAQADALTRTLPEVETNYVPNEKNGDLRYRYGEEAIARLTVAPGYHIELFASEVEFPDLANPVQMSFDNQGRLWVSTMPSYPHWRPGDPKPDDKLLILEDTDHDGKADRQIVWADSLHLPVGFEFAPGGVYVSQGTNLVLLADTDNDDRADTKEIILSGFDDHDTHHVISAFTADPSGAIYMAEGVFLHSNVETAYGPVRGTNGGFFRFNPVHHHLERTAQLSIPNPWGITFDNWGQPFFTETSDPNVRWLLPGTVRPRYGIAVHKSFNLIEDAHRVRPTSGIEFVSSRHFPDEVQGDLLINNTIGFLGMKQHAFYDEGTGFASRHRQDLVQSSDGNFRPVDLEFAPDGSLYFVDWHNILIGHMQHSARDPLRDHAHGRIYRVTYPARPLVEPARIADASIEELLENLKLPEYRSRYRTRRALRGYPASEVLPLLSTWVEALDSEDSRYEHHLLEALWVTWGLNRVDEDLLGRLMEAEDYRARAAAVRVLRYNPQLDSQPEKLLRMAADPHGRVRLEAMVAASWQTPDVGVPVVEEASRHLLDRWSINVSVTALAHLKGETVQTQSPDDQIPEDLEGEVQMQYTAGREIYRRDSFCGTCHLRDGTGLPAAGFPPLAGADWVTGDTGRLIRITLDGLIGPIEVNGTVYPGQVPMTPFRNLLTDEEIAAVLTYVRNAFGNRASPIAAVEVAQVRQQTQERQGFYSARELNGGQ